jgi:hypothetical protein
MEEKLAELHERLLAAQVKKAELELARTEEEVRSWEAQRETRKRQNQQALNDLKHHHSDRLAVIKSCTHRQGGTPGRERQGNDKSALNLVIMMDGRELIMCANCPLRVFSPFIGDKNPARRKNETDAQAKARVEKYKADMAEFERLKEHARDKLTPQAATPMHCGNTFEFQDANGNRIPMRAPCDSYVQGRDNRQAA